MTNRHVLIAGAIAIAWTAGTVGSLLLGVLVHPVFAGIAVGSVLSAILIRKMMVLLLKSALGDISDQVDGMYDELQAMVDDIDRR